MAGIEAAEEMTSDQLDAMAGGDLLKNEVNYSSFMNMQCQFNSDLNANKLILKLFLSRPVTSVKFATRRNLRSV